ncbi:MAG TPA: YlzJ-like family protein [Limnochordia bacterium]|nr:YlzJ-like family protein [Limnochordia bacterium]
MLLYTVLPLDDVFEGIEAKPVATMDLRLGGMDLEVEQLGGFRVRIVRVISTDPQHYLLPHCQPGSVIRMDPF